MFASAAGRALFRWRLLKPHEKRPTLPTERNTQVLITNNNSVVKEIQVALGRGFLWIPQVFYLHELRPHHVPPKQIPGTKIS